MFSRHLKICKKSIFKGTKSKFTTQSVKLPNSFLFLFISCTHFFLSCLTQGKQEYFFFVRKTGVSFKKDGENRKCELKS